MAAPTPSARGTPTGFKMPDGYSSLISFASAPTIGFWEKTVKPAGFDGGDPIDTTTMHNKTWRTKNPRSLKTLTDGTCNAAYDPDVISTIETLINKEDSITYHFPTGDQFTFWGFLQKFEPGEMKEGEMPEATITIVPINYDITTQTEEAPVYTGSGT